MSIDLTRDELERLILLVSRSLMDQPDTNLDSVADKLMAALFGDERTAPPAPLWDAGGSESD